MKNLILIALFIASPLFAGYGTIDSSSNNITTAYSTGAGSKLMVDQGTVSGITVQNKTGGDIEVTWGTASCVSSQDTKILVQASQSNTKDFKNAQGVRMVCVRSVSGTLSSGLVIGETW